MPNLTNDTQSETWGHFVVKLTHNPHPVLLKNYQSRGHHGDLPDWDVRAIREHHSLLASLNGVNDLDQEDRVTRG